MKFPDYKQVKVKDLIPYARNSLVWYALDAFKGHD